MQFQAQKGPSFSVMLGGKFRQVFCDSLDLPTTFWPQIWTAGKLKNTHSKYGKYIHFREFFFINVMNSQNKDNSSGNKMVHNCISLCFLNGNYPWQIFYLFLTFTNSRIQSAAQSLFEPCFFKGFKRHFAAL